MSASADKGVLPLTVNLFFSAVTSSIIFFFVLMPGESSEYTGQKSEYADGKSVLFCLNHFYYIYLCARAARALTKKKRLTSREESKTKQKE